MIEKVAIEIDIVLGPAQPPGEAVGIDRMHHQHGDVGRQSPRTALADPCKLRRRSAISFGTMHATAVEQHRSGIRGAEPRRVGEKWRQLRTLRMRVFMRRDAGAGRLGRSEKARAGLHIGFREEFRGLHARDLFRPLSGMKPEC